ncbi:MAG: purine-nucleoside/S-methyl-5-thioadenosine phosphorylase / adenosine deaminase [Actinomycetota bacterium]|nr:purine-nucleoside/S-methyl-5-thioadenosine phosphorylase / adenosine deaminase [Actinomycetota bacterium]
MPVTPRLLQIDLGPGVLAGFTTRENGVSVGPWHGLNLGDHVGDEPGAVAQNRRSLAERVGAPVRFLRQVHGVDVLVPDPAVPGPAVPDPVLVPDPGPQQGHDAIVLRAGAGAGAVMVADCAPVLLADPQAGLVAAAHAGRVGLLAGVLQATVERMRALGAQPRRIRAAVGPCAGPCCYEVGEELRALAAEVLPDTWARTRSGTASIDLRAGCRQALGQVGVRRVEVLDRCTVEDDSFYSYRRSSITGRFVGVIRSLT